MDALSGFRAFLAGAALPGRESLALALTPEIIECFLPYALALDVAPAWGARCAGTLTATYANGAFSLPGWYAGRAWSHGTVRDLINALTKTLPAAIQRAQQHPGEEQLERAERAGSHGGGGSGGGGGGGGW